MQMFCSTSAQKASRASRHRRPASPPTHVLIMSTCLQLRKHTSTPYCTLPDWELADSQPLENRLCHNRKSSRRRVKIWGGIRGQISLHAGDREITSLHIEGQKSKISPLSWEASGGINLSACLVFLPTIGLRVRRWRENLRQEQKYVKTRGPSGLVLPILFSPSSVRTERWRGQLSVSGELCSAPRNLTPSSVK